MPKRTTLLSPLHVMFYQSFCVYFTCTLVVVTSRWQEFIYDPLSEFLKVNNKLQKQYLVYLSPSIPVDDFCFSPITSTSMDVRPSSFDVASPEKKKNLTCIYISQQIVHEILQNLIKSNILSFELNWLGFFLNYNADTVNFLTVQTKLKTINMLMLKQHTCHKILVFLLLSGAFGYIILLICILYSCCVIKAFTL